MASVELFDRQLQALRDEENALVSGNYSGIGVNSTSALLKAIKLLKECVYIFRHQLQLDEPLVSQTYRYGVLKGEFSDICRKILNAIANEAPYGVVGNISNDVEAFYQELSKLVDMASRTDSAERRQTQELQRRVFDYEKTIKKMEAQAEAASSAVSSVRNIVEGKTAKEWTDEYLLYVRPDDTSKKLIDRKLSAINKKFYAPTVDAQLERWGRRFGLSLYRLYRASFRDVIFYNGISYVNTVKKWRFWRAVWLTILLAVAVTYAVVFWNFDVKSQGVSNFILEKSAFLPMLLVISLGFSFSARNYKINAHLLEQYKHRYVVAKTMQNLMLLEDLKADQSIRSELIQQGSKVLFEFRNAGYMNKNDPSDMPTMKEIMNSGLFKREV